MENKKKMIFNVLFLFLVFAATIYGVFHGEDLSEIAEILKTVNSYWLQITKIEKDRKIK